MDNGFGETLRRLRTEAGLTQSQVAQQLYVTRSAVARWESGTRLPDAAMVSRLAACLGVEADRLLNPVTREGGAVNVIVVDDERIVLAHELPVIRQALPAAKISGFQRPSEALEYARSNPVALAFLDIEMGRTSGLELCRRLIELNPRTNVVFLTAYREYSYDAWGTGASGFLLKPLIEDDVRGVLGRLRYPIFPGGGLRIHERMD